MNHSTPLTLRFTLMRYVYTNRPRPPSAKALGALTPPTNWAGNVVSVPAHDAWPCAWAAARGVFACARPCIFHP